MFNEIPPNLMRLELPSLDQAALIHAGIDPMAVGDCERAEKENWVGWEIAKANREALLQAVVTKKIRPVYATVWVPQLDSEQGREEEIDVDTITVKHLNSLRNAIFHRDDVLAFFGYQTKPEEATTGPSQAESQPKQDYSINSPAFDRLMQAIEAFPVEHSDYKTKPPKRERIQEWVRSRFVSNDKTREPSFIAKVIIEHFDIPDKTGRRSKT